MRSVLGMLRGLTGSLKGSLMAGARLDRMENWSIAFIVLGALAFAAGMLLSAWQTQGLAALLSMFGTLASFLATAVLVFIWLMKEIKNRPEGTG